MYASRQVFDTSVIVTAILVIETSRGVRYLATVCWKTRSRGHKPNFTISAPSPSRHLVTNAPLPLPVIPAPCILVNPTVIIGRATASAADLRGVERDQGMAGQASPWSAVPCHPVLAYRDHVTGGRVLAGGAPMAEGTTTVRVSSSAHPQRANVPPRGGGAVGFLHTRP